MKHKLFIALFFSLLGITISFANTVKITGRVLFMNDSTAVSGATVRLLNNNKTVITGTTTDAQGKFSITYKTTNNAHQIEVSFVGYIPVSININRGNNDINTGDIYLLEENKGLSEVVVTGALRKVNRQLVFPNKQQIKASQDFIALLQNLSLNGLFVDQINQKALIHNKPIQWKINGTPQSFNEVKNLSPNAILRIDYSEMPSVRELDKGFGGVINVILKERTDGGAIRTHLQSALWVGFINANANANYHKDKSDFTIHYSSNYRNYPKWQKTMEQDFFGDNIHINRSEIPENSPFKYLEQNINLTYAHKFNNNKMFSATWRNTINSQSNDVRNNITQSGKNTFHRSSKSLYKQYIPVLDLYFQNTLHNGGKIEANLVGTLSLGKDQRDLTDKIQETVISSISNPVNTKYHSIISEVTYEKTINPKLHLNTGLQNKYSYTFNKYLSNYYLDKMHQNNTYLYGQISGQFNNKFQYQAGTGIKLFHVNKGAETKTYLKSQGSLALFYIPTNKLSFSLNSNFIPYLPTLAQLSGVTQRFDSISVHTGNPALKPSQQFTNRFNVNYNNGKFTSTISLNYIYTKAPVFTNVTYKPAEKYFLFYPNNGIYNKQYGCEWKTTYRNIYDFLSLYGTVGWNHYKSNVGNNPLHLNSFYWDASAQILYKDFVLAMFYANNGKTLYNETITATGNNAGITLMYNKRNWTLYAQMMYVGIPDGDTYITINHSKVNPYKSVVKIPENGNMLTLGVVWNLDFGKQKNKINRNLNNSDNNQSVIKVQE